MDAPDQHRDSHREQLNDDANQHAKRRVYGTSSLMFWGIFPLLAIAVILILIFAL